jgi:hypothetical protein
VPGLDDVRRLALALPGASERVSAGALQWRVGDRLFVWERPLRRADRAALGAAAPSGDVLGVRVPDLEDKEALLAEHAPAVFTSPHFDGYPIVLVALEDIDPALLDELVTDAWRDRAPARLRAERPSDND